MAKKSQQRFDVNVIMTPINFIKPYEQNAKKHPKEQIEKLAKHIEHVGWDQPIVVDEDNIILKGHGRLLAAKQLGLVDVPVVVKKGLSEIQKKSCRIADNKLAESKWDFDLLKLDLEILRLELDITDLGFDTSFLNANDDKNIDDIEDFKKTFDIIVEFAEEEAQQLFFNEITKRGLTCKIL